MKTNARAFLLIVLFLGSLPLAAQELSKDEKKALKKEIKNYKKNPEAFKAFKDGIEDKKKQLTRLNSQISEIDRSIQDVQNQVSQKDEQIKRLQDEIRRLEQQENETEVIVNDQTNLQGLVYKVQVSIDEAALYEKVDKTTGETQPVFTGEVDADGTKKYTLGYFRDKTEAETFKSYLKLLRIKNAIVVPYRDGKKVNE